MRDRTFLFALLCMLALLSTALFVESEQLAWRLCGVAVGSSLGGFIWASLLDFQKRCRHPNLYEKKWITEEGAPMIRQWCPNCNFHRYGQEEIT